MREHVNDQAETIRDAGRVRHAHLPAVLKRTMGPRLVYKLAGPLESPITPSKFGVLGVASNVAVKLPVCEESARDCHVPALV
jgi:hypothetical protein